ncbi:hypothetical protein PR048_029300 [Dryococelus australis]|uniref:Uncharacterized protein n=1 Tax=Dryococelus australis TaxID=614101 RepID=A0ABQ9GD15_9NEOP|nr:hypothetical protein PR048_029300 [Dryococelus australis]
MELGRSGQFAVMQFSVRDVSTWSVVSNQSQSVELARNLHAQLSEVTSSWCLVNFLKTTNREHNPTFHETPRAICSLEIVIDLSKDVSCRASGLFRASWQDCEWNAIKVDHTCTPRGAARRVVSPLPFATAREAKQLPAPWAAVTTQLELNKAKVRADRWALAEGGCVPSAYSHTTVKARSNETKPSNILQLSARAESATLPGLVYFRAPAFCSVAAASTCRQFYLRSVGMVFGAGCLLQVVYGLRIHPARLSPGRSGFNPLPGHSGSSHVGIVLDDAVGRRVFSEMSRFPRPFIPALLDPRLTLIGSQDLDVKSCPNLFTHVHTWFTLVSVSEILASDVVVVDTHVGTCVRGQSRSADHSTADELLWTRSEKDRVILAADAIKALRASEPGVGECLKFGRLRDLKGTKTSIYRDRRLRANNDFTENVSVHRTLKRQTTSENSNERQENPVANRRIDGAECSLRGRPLRGGTSPAAARCEENARAQWGAAPCMRVHSAATRAPFCGVSTTLCAGGTCFKTSEETANRTRFPAESPPDFRMWESCRTMPLVGGVSSGISRSSHPYVPAPIHTHLASLSSVLKTSALRAAQFSSLTLNSGNIGVLIIWFSKRKTN